MQQSNATFAGASIDFKWIPNRMTWGGSIIIIKSNYFLMLCPGHNMVLMLCPGHNISLMLCPGDNMVLMLCPGHKIVFMLCLGHNIRK